MPEIIYGGPTSREDISTAFQARDAKGKPHMLRKGVATDVPPDVASLLLGEDKPTGHKFEAAPEKPAESDTSTTATAEENATSGDAAPATASTETPTTASRRGRAGSES